MFHAMKEALKRRAAKGFSKDDELHDGDGPHVDIHEKDFNNHQDVKMKGHPDEVDDLAPDVKDTMEMHDSKSDLARFKDAKGAVDEVNEGHLPLHDSMEDTGPKDLVHHIAKHFQKPVGRHSMTLDERAHDLMNKKMKK